MESEEIENGEAGSVSKARSNNAGNGAKTAYENSKEQRNEMNWENAKRLLFKTNNDLRPHTTYIAWSGACFAGALNAPGMKTVRKKAGTNRSGGVCLFEAFGALAGHCSARAVLA